MSGEEASPGLRPAPVLVFLRDPESREGAATPLLGRSIASRVAVAARAAGFARVLVAPGVEGAPAGVEETAEGQALPDPALLLFDTSCVAPELLRLMVAHPLADGEGFTLYDGIGRPAGYFAGGLSRVPDAMPLGDELELPEGIGADRVGRFLEPADRERIERLALACDGIELPLATPWYRAVALPLLRRAAASRHAVDRLETAALLLLLPAALLTAAAGTVGLVLGALLVLAAIQLGALAPSLAMLRGEGPWGRPYAQSVRPLAHAAATASLTLRVFEELAAEARWQWLVVGLGGVATVLALAQARRLLRRHRDPGDGPDDRYDLPDRQVLARRLGAAVPAAWAGIPLLELAAALLALAGWAVLPWSVYMVAGSARLWRWFSGRDEERPAPR